MIGSWVGTTAMSLLLLQAQVPEVVAPQAGSGRMTSDQQFQLAMEALKRNPGGILDNLTGVLALLVPFGFFVMILGIVWLHHRQRRAQMQTQAEFNKQLLEKFSSGREFAEFLETKGSQRFLEELWSQRTGPHRTLETMRNGIVMSFLGLGMLALSWWTRGFRTPGILALALGVGFLVSSAISQHLSKRSQDKSEAEAPRVT